MPRIGGGAVKQRGADEGEAEAETRENQSPERRIRRRGRGIGLPPTGVCLRLGADDQRGAEERGGGQDGEIRERQCGRDARAESERREERIRFRFQRGGGWRRAAYAGCYQVSPFIMPGPCLHCGPACLPKHGTVFVPGRPRHGSKRAGPCSCRASIVSGHVLSGGLARLDNTRLHQLKCF
jgi:hypothetical protein